MSNSTTNRPLTGAAKAAADRKAAAAGKANPDALLEERHGRRRITLADLSAEDKRALLEEARELTRHNPVDVPGYEDLSEREQVIRGLMDARDHARMCPVVEGSELGRVEGYDARRPPDPASGAPERWFGVVRCIGCGGATVLDDRLEPSIAGELERREEQDETSDAGGDPNDDEL